MHEIVIISGKGGTGKTSLTAAFASLAERPVLADCDVDAADLHLILNPKIDKREDFSGGSLASVNAEKCTGCGRCKELCQFDAITMKEVNGKVIADIDPIGCEGCGVCAWFCETKAAIMTPAINGEVYQSSTRFGPMSHARLGIAEENSGKLVTVVRKAARKMAEEGNHPLILVDGSPGIGCPVIASVTGSDLVVIVTEPTVSGEHDLLRVADLAKHFKIAASVVINKADINTEVADRITTLAEERGMSVLGRIPYDDVVTAAMVERKTITEYDEDGPVGRTIRQTWTKILAALPEKPVAAGV